MKIGGLFISNWAYLVWFVFYFILSVFFLNLFTATIENAIMISILLYLVSIAFALSDIGETILRNKQGVRKPKIREEKNYLLPLFEEVYATALENNPSLSRRINLYILDSYEINAFAYGRKTIILTLGSIEHFNENELKGILAHEFGHINHGDTKALLLNLIGNGFFTAIIGFLNIFIKIFTGMVARKKDSEYAVWFLKFIIGICNLIIGIILGFGNLLMKLNSRSSEYLADLYAHNNGYGEDLRDALVLINRVYASGNYSLKDRLNSTHPHILDRIERLENIEQ